MNLTEHYLTNLLVEFKADIITGCSLVDKDNCIDAQIPFNCDIHTCTTLTMKRNIIIASLQEHTLSISNSQICYAKIQLCRNIPGAFRSLVTA